MLRFGLVLLLAASAIAAPNSYYEIITADGVEGLGTVPNSGRANHLTDGITNLIDNGELSFFYLTVQGILNDLASSSDRYSQALAVSSAIGTMIPLSSGVAGDACSSANLINAYASGNYQGALRNYIRNEVNSLARLAKLAQDPQSARFSVGPRSGCNSAGRNSLLVAAWDRVLETTPANPLVEQLFCTSKRLYNAFDVKHNNVAASLTAHSLPPVVAVYERAYGPIVNFVNALISRSNINQALAQAQNALISSV